MGSGGPCEERLTSLVRDLEANELSRLKGHNARGEVPLILVLKRFRNKQLWEVWKLES